MTLSRDDTAGEGNPGFTYARCSLGALATDLDVGQGSVDLRIQSLDDARQDAWLVCAMPLERAVDEIARGGVQRLIVSPPIGLPSFGLFFRRDGMERPLILTEFADAIRQVTKVGAPKRRAAMR